MEQADLIVIGSGQGGSPLAGNFAKSGKRVVLFERAEIGGSCVNYGCTPSKALLASAHAAGRARQAGPLGVRAEPQIDFPAVMRRVREIRGKWRSGAAGGLEKAGVRVVRAEGRFTGERTVEGGGVAVRGEQVVINTGTGPAMPDIPGLREAEPLTNETVFDIESAPGRMVVLGAGYIGLELGQAFRRLGVEVDIVNRGERPLGREEDKVGDTLAEALRADGVELRMKTTVERVENAGGKKIVVLSDGNRIECDAILVAAGRTPNSSALNVSATGVKLDDRGYVKTDEHLRTECDGVFAIGDVAAQPAFTHVAWEDHRRLLSTWSGEPRTRDDRVLAYACFTEPQVGRVGMTLEQAKQAGHDARMVEMEAKSVARAAEWGHELGFWRLVVENETDRILGATLVGYEAGELVQVIQAHMEAGSTWRTLERTGHIHPTYGEGLASLARMAG